MNDAEQRSITVADDAALCRLIQAANQRLVVLAPAVSKAIAAAITERLHTLGQAVSVILDVDPEVYRLGYGDQEALPILEAAFERAGGMLQRQTGVRVGLVISDERMMVYSPTPLLVEAGSSTTQGTTPPRPNAVLLQSPPPEILREVGHGQGGVVGQTIGLDKAAKAEIQSVQEDLKKNPPQNFDIARTVRVFNAHFEFVEFELLGTFIDRKTVRIPKHLSGIADEKTREQLRQSFTILPPNHKLSGEHLLHNKRLIERKYLKQIKGFGNVLLRTRKEDFLKEVETLQADVKAFGEQVRDQLQSEMDKNRQTLVKAMLPIVKRSTPKEWVPWNGSKPDAATLSQFLDEDLRKAFGTAEQLVHEMQVKIVIKGITWEMLHDKEFIEAARSAMPDDKALYELFDAARAKPKTVQGAT